jgi:prepilin-type N-terminal cleavage/methylation domain-containing protein
VSRLIKNQRGFNLVELSVTIVLLTVVGAAGLALFSAGYNTVSRTEERLQQIDRGERALGAINALLAQSDPSNLGLPTSGLPALSAPGGSTIPATPAGLLPPSLSGQQMTFAAGQRCYRIFYRSGSIWLAVANNCLALANNNSGLQRGPEQFTAVFSPTQALYDPVLDLTANSQQRLITNSFTAYPLATGIAPLGPDQPLFSYKFLDFRNVQTSATGHLGDNLPFYQQANERNKIIAVELQFRVLADVGNISDKEYRQVLYIGQSCRRQ